jgi:hypothetical protein
MSAQDDLATLLAALQVLHSNSDRTQKEEAHNYLEAFQKLVSQPKQRKRLTM